MELIIKDKYTLAELTDVNIGISYDSVLPSIKTATKQYLIKNISADVYESLQEWEYESGVKKEIYQLAQAVVANMALLLYIPRSEAMLTDAGIRRGGTDELPGAYKYQVKELEESYRLQGMVALDDLIGKLEENYSTITEWADSDIRKKRNKLLIRSGAELSDILANNLPHLNFAQIAADIYNAELLILNPEIGESLLADLKAKRSVNALSALEKELLSLIQRANIYLALYLAIPTLHIQINDQGLTISSGGGDSSMGKEAKRNSADLDSVDYMKRNFKEKGYTLLGEIVKFLRMNGSETVFTVWWDIHGKTIATDINGLNTPGTGIFSF